MLLGSILDGPEKSFKGILLFGQLFYIVAKKGKASLVIGHIIGTLTLAGGALGTCRSLAVALKDEG